MKSKNSLIVLYVAVSVLCFILSLTNIDLFSIIVNVIFFIVVGIMFFQSRKKFGIIDQISTDFTSVIQRISNDHKDNKLNLQSLYEESDENLFSNYVLLSKYKEYKDELKRMKLQTNCNYRCDISDYINVNMIDVKINKNILNLIPATLTGMGILGTFVGLSFALANFKIFDELNELQNSTNILMGGIKVAFHTSIYGMIFSLCYNFLYKKTLENAYNKVEDFLNVYDKYVTGDTNNSNESQIQILLKEMPAQIGLQMKDVFALEFEKVDKTIDMFGENAEKSQAAGMEKIVKYFIDSMNTMLGESLSNLGKVISDTTKLQEENNGYTQDVLSKIGTMALNIHEINEISGETIKNMSDYSSKVDELQTTINDKFNNICDRMENETTKLEKVKEFINIMSDNSKLLTDKSTEFVSEIGNQINALTKIVESISDNAKKNLDTIALSAEQHQSTLSEQSEKQLDIIKNLSNSVVESVDKTTSRYIDKLSQHEDMLEKESVNFASEINKQLEVIAQFEQYLSESAQNNMQSLADNAEKINDKLFQTSKDQIQSIQNTSADITNSIGDATNELADISKNLSKNLKDSLDKTFNEFDTNLAQITICLSGTIKDVKDTTDRVPATVNAAYDGMERSLNELEKSFSSLTTNLKDFNKNISIKLDDDKIEEVEIKQKV